MIVFDFFFFFLQSRTSHKNHEMYEKILQKCYTVAKGFWVVV